MSDEVIIIDGWPTVVVKEKLSWEQVFNTNFERYGIISEGGKAAFKAGYPYFVWNRRVFYSKSGYFTGVLEDQL